MKITGIILAGGKSRRMGKDKALLEIEGQTLLQRAVHFCQSFCDEILISSNSLNHEVEGIQIVPDEITDCGPIGGIYSCIKQSKNEWNFVLSVDAAFVEPEFVSFLSTKINDCDAVVPFHYRGKEPLIAFYHRDTLKYFKLQLEEQEYKMHFLLEEIKACFVDSNQWIEKYPLLFNNLNSPEDLILL